MNKERFNLMLNIIRSQPWLGDKTDELEHVLFSECQCNTSRQLVSEIIDRFFYINREDNYKLIDSLANEIISKYSDRESSTLITAMGTGSATDSSQLVAYTLKPIMEKKKWRRHAIINDFGAVYKQYKKTKHNHIVLIDEFVGSGQTVLGRVESIHTQLKNAGVQDYSIAVKVLVSTEFGLGNVTAAGIDMTAQRLVKKGIDDYYSSEDAAQHRDLMKFVERNLSAEYEGRAMPSLGYNEAQATYYREDGNTPNSVFPIFWWAFNCDGEDRHVLMTRAMGDA
ncbi:phosphoribosyltransferase-like protein [Pseudomonas sp. 31 R 17]|uniref:phosphoribosyltransferase-like protein n=1 Tax=Pseudomonas sp. 31 R 17 TaxID=1844101 RepID=UPI00114708F1|nr:hypothetical protein [Pseudomonas sp. 31 R 17]